MAYSVCHAILNLSDFSEMLSEIYTMEMCCFLKHIMHSQINKLYVL